MSTVGNVIDAVGYRLGGRQIDESTIPSLSQCISQLNGDIQWILGKCAEQESEIGRTLATITTVDGTAEYSDLMSDLYSPSSYAWIEKTYDRCKLKLTTQEKLIDYSPDSGSEAEPEYYYIGGNNALTFIPTPDDAYTVKMPYYQEQTSLTSRSSTMPFNGLFDNLLIESMVLRFTDNKEDDPNYEFKWFQSWDNRVKRMIELRKNINSSVGI